MATWARAGTRSTGTGRKMFSLFFFCFCLSATWELAASQQPPTAFSPVLEPSRSHSARESSLPNSSLPSSASPQPSLIPGVPSESQLPIASPSSLSSRSPSMKPNDNPTSSHRPSVQPSEVRTDIPSASLSSSVLPSWAPTRQPSINPSENLSSLPSAAPRISVERDVGLYVTGLGDTFNEGSSKSRQFERLVDEHTKLYWLNASNGGSVVYNSTTEFIGTLPPPRDWKIHRVMRQVQRVSSDGAGSEIRQASPIILNTSDTDGVSFNQNFSSVNENKTSTLTLTPSEGLDENSGNQSSQNESELATARPTVTPQSSSQSLLFSPSSSLLPSTAPSASAQPSDTPTRLPKIRTWVLWYRQEIVYGEKFDTNDTRANTVSEIFKFPFLLDQLRFTNELIEITDNQLAIFVDDVDVRDGSEAPSIESSEAPSSTPSSEIFSIPTLAPVSLDTGGVSTTTVIIAVAVPFMLLVLLIAFAGIIYVTRIENDVLAPGRSFEGEVISLPPEQQDPGTFPGGVASPLQDTLDGEEHLSETTSFPTGALTTLGLHGPLSPIPSSKELTAQPPSASHAFQPKPFRDPSITTGITDHPVDFLSPPRRTASNAESMISDMSVDSRRAPPFYTAAFTPTLASVPSPGSANSHNRTSSYQGSSTTTPFRSGLIRAATTGGMPRTSASGRLSPAERMSPFQSVQGGIPTIHVTQVSPATDTSGLGGDARHDDAVSQSDTESEPPSMRAFNLQIQDLDDF